MYNGDAPANTPHRPGPGKATVQRLRCRLFTSTGATSGVRQSLTIEQAYSNVKY